MAVLNNGVSDNLYQSVKNPIAITNRLAGVSFTGSGIGPLGLSASLYRSTKNIIPVSNRLAGAGGSKGTDPGGGGGSSRITKIGGSVT